MTILVHPTAIVADGALLHDGVEVGPYCVISGNVTIGEETKLAAFVRVRDYVEIGRNCTVAENSVLGGEPQDHDFKGEETWVRIGDGVILRESVTIHRSTGVGTCTSVGAGCFLMEGVHVAHNVTIGKNVTVANKAGFAGHSSVGDGAVIGGMAGVHQFTRVGKLCMVGGLSKVVKDIPPFLMVDGHPAEIEALNVVGLKRSGYDREQRRNIKDAYHHLYRSGLPFRKAVDSLRADDADAAVRDILDFVRESKRGVALWHSGRASAGKEREETGRRPDERENSTSGA